jgi:6-phosphogluconolactonase (cycloisomerase 2 family)
VFAIRAGQWNVIQSVKSDRPVSLALSTDKRFLYAANEVSQYKGLPTGTVEAFAVGRDGTLTLINRQALSLSATMPRHLSIAPNGRSLVVTAQGGAVYNVLPIAEDGSVSRASGILKETGTGENAARLQMAIFDDAGRVVGADQGTGRISVMGIDHEGLAPHARHATENGSGPVQIALHPRTDALYVAHQDSLQRYQYDTRDGKLLGLKQQVPSTGVADGSNTLAIHPAGEMLLTCNGDRGIRTWKIDRFSGALRPAGLQVEELGRLHAIDVSSNGTSILAINHERGLVLGATIDAATSRVSNGRTLARVTSPKSLAVIYS